MEDDDVIICDEDAECKKCGSKECDEDDMLICSNEHCGANGAYHLRCLDPPLDDVPEGDWFCPNCEDKQAATAPQGDSLAKPLLATRSVPFINHARATAISFVVRRFRTSCWPKEDLLRWIFFSGRIA